MKRIPIVSEETVARKIVRHYLRFRKVATENSLKFASLETMMEDVCWFDSLTPEDQVMTKTARVRIKKTASKILKSQDLAAGWQQGPCDSCGNEFSHKPNQTPCTHC